MSKIIFRLSPVFIFYVRLSKGKGPKCIFATISEDNCIESKMVIAMISSLAIITHFHRYVQYKK